MKKTMISILIGIVLGALAGYGHIRSVQNTEPWYIANRPEPVIYEVKHIHTKIN